MSQAINQLNQAGQVNPSTMTFAVAELGAFQTSVDSLTYSLNKTEQNKIVKRVVSFLSQMARVREGKALSNIKLVGYATEYDLEKDDLFYTFSFVEVPPLPAKPF